MTAAWLGRIIFWTPFVLALCVARQVTQSYLPKVLEPKESEQVRKAERKEVRRKKERRKERNNVRLKENMKTCL